VPASPDPLTRLARAARAKGRADERYRAAFLFALAELEASDAPDPFAQLGRLLVNLNVDAAPYQRQRRREAADARAYDCDRGGHEVSVRRAG